MPKALRCCTLLNGRVIPRSLNGWKNLLSICLAHLFAHSIQAILGLQWMLDYEDVPGEYDACEYLWSSEIINHLASSHKMTRSPTWFIGSQCVKELVFPLIFLLWERFFGFLHSCFSYIFLLQREVFWALIFYVLRFFCICYVLYLCEVWVFWKSRIYVELMSIQERLSPNAGQVLHLAGIITHISGWRRPNRCNILYIAIIALSLC